MEENKKEDKPKNIQKIYKKREYYSNNGLIFLGLILLAFAVILSYNKIGISILDPSGFEKVQPINVSIIDPKNSLFSYFLTMPYTNTTLTSKGNVQDIVINVDSSTGCNVFDAINIYDNNNYFQALIQSITPTTITMNMPLDVNFDTSNTIVECAAWDLSTTDGSTTEKVFSISPPSNKTWDITNTVVTILDNKPMDSSLFGGLPPLPNGIIGRFVDNHKQNLFVIYNNNGFILRGFDMNYIPKTPSGYYGLDATLNFQKTFGDIVSLYGSEKDKWEAVNQDDLTALDSVAITVSGNVIK